MKQKFIIFILLLIPAFYLFGDAQAQITVYRTRTGEMYHRAGCTSLRQSQIALSLQEAVRIGLRPCSRCNPPTLAPRVQAAPQSQPQPQPTNEVENLDEDVEQNKP